MFTDPGRGRNLIRARALMGYRIEQCASVLVAALLAVRPSPPVSASAGLEHAGGRVTVRQGARDTILYRYISM
jgi:hypothetical protein